MKLKDTCMSSPILCQNFKMSMHFKKFPFALQTIFSLNNLEADNFFQPTTACEQFFFTKKVTPPLPIKKK